ANTRPASATTNDADTAPENCPAIRTDTVAVLAPEQSEAVRRSLGYGLDEKVVLPRGAVEKVTVSGPEFLGRELEKAEVRWDPAQAGPAAGVEADLVFLDGDQITASYPGTLKHLGLGSVGRSVRMELGGRPASAADASESATRSVVDVLVLAGEA
ncbi:hypothetical protein, partial [Streptomyces sp. NPDC002132]|uniref:hypothetical protein n=1 Tax=unclassified Streptomyces TaxID=2593676 RepID=UPI0033237C49